MKCAAEMLNAAVAHLKGHVGNAVAFVQKEPFGFLNSQFVEVGSYAFAHIQLESAAEIAC